MKLGIRSQDLGLTDINEIAARLNELRLDGVQLVCYKTFPNISYDVGQVDRLKAEDIFKALNSQNKEVFLIGAYFNPVHSSELKKEKGVAVFKDYLALAKTFSPYACVASETGSYNDDRWTFHENNSLATSQDEVYKAFKDLTDYAKESGAIVGLEGAAGHVCHSVRAMADIKNRINSKSLKIVFDIFNMLSKQNHSDYLNILKSAINEFKKDIHCFHLKDYVLTNGEIKQVPPGKGLFDYKEILKLIKASNENAILILEGTTGADILQAASFIRTTWNSSSIGN